MAAAFGRPGRGLRRLAAIAACFLAFPAAGGVGANKFDLAQQYLGRASGGDGSEPYRSVTRAMARKALDDARDANIRLLRVSLPGFLPIVRGRSGDLDLWVQSPELYWARIAEMLDDLDARQIQIVPALMWSPRQFPAMAGGTMADLVRDADSASARLLWRYAGDFVRRFRDRKTVVFYELTNELNLHVDLDNVSHCARTRPQAECAVAGNFSTDDLIAFIGRFAALVKSLDQSRGISSGFTAPRASAEHLRARPGWSSRGADWSQDTLEQFERNLRDVNAPVDIISIHMYDSPGTRRFGGDAIDLIAAAKRAADREGKTLFVGEFGERKPGGASGQSFSFKAIDAFERLGVRYSAVWVWQLYQGRPYRRLEDGPPPFSLEPGHTDALIGRIAKANGADRNNRTPDTQPPRLVLTWPLECAELASQQEAYAVASDNSGKLSGVELRIGAAWKAEAAAPPYHWRFDTAPLRSGEHTLEAATRDAAGNPATQVRKVFVRDPAGAKQCRAALQRP